ncbi:MAG: hypothetical protein ABJA83_14710 [Burkholderiaceae bacterium]
MSKWRCTLGSLLLLATLGSAEITAAKQIRGQNFGLTHTKTECDGNRTFRYVATWQAPAGSKSQVTAYKCGRVGPISCNAAGKCSVQVNGCVAGPSWFEVGVILATSPADIQQQRLGVPWPTDASGTKKEVCT